MARQSVWDDWGRLRVSHQRKRSVPQSLHLTASNNTPPSPSSITMVAVLEVIVSSDPWLSGRFGWIHHVLRIRVHYCCPAVRLNPRINRYQQHRAFGFDDDSYQWTSYTARLQSVDAALKLVSPLATSSFLSSSRKFMRKELNMFRVTTFLQGP